MGGPAWRIHTGVLLRSRRRSRRSRVTDPYTQTLIPAAQIESVKGTVVKKERESNRLLMTLSTPKGVLLATFTQKIDEIDLLVSEGYTATIRLRTYSPFVENPVIERVDAATADQDSDSRQSATQ